MAKTATPLTAQERVILFCIATGISHAAVGITAHAMPRERSIYDAWGMRGLT